MSAPIFNNKSQPQSFAERAATVTKYGVPVIPLEPRSKGTLLKSWQTLATTDAKQIADWNQRNPDFNCGAVARAGGDWIFDVDDPSVYERIQNETGHGIDELDTLVVRSSGEKKHFYFRQDERSEAIGNINASENGELFSVRAHNRYVVSPGSIHPETGQSYEIIMEPRWGEIPTAPEWLLNWLAGFKTKSKPAQVVGSVEPEVIREGSRNNRLTSIAGAMRRQGASESAILAALRETNRQQCRPPLSDDEVAQIAKSVSRYEPVGDESEERESETTIAPSYPSDTIDGDLIGELTRALTDGTFVPPQFMRENIKVALGSIVDEFVGFPNHEDLHTREYLHNVSPHAQSGKGESFKRTIDTERGFLRELLRNFRVSTVDGGLFGSGEFMVKILNDVPTHRSIARFDEMSELWSKNRALGCTLEKKLLTLFESTTAAQGSFKNGVHAASDLHLSIVGDFTKDSFDASFTGSGSRGSGYLSRCVFQFADKQPLIGDWQSIDVEKVRRILSEIEARLTCIENHGEGRVIPSEDPESKSLRLEFGEWLDKQDARFTPRLKDHLKRDVLLRALFSKSIVIDAEMMRRSIAWCKNQLENRIALFPEDAGSAVEIMERGILRVIQTKGRASERELQRACHVDRAGCGGHEAFNRARNSLVLGHEIRVIDKTRKGLPVYGSFSEAA